MTRLQSGWLPALGTYLAAIVAMNLVWEVLQLPLFTIWTTGTLAEQAPLLQWLVVPTPAFLIGDAVVRRRWRSDLSETRGGG